VFKTAFGLEMGLFLRFCVFGLIEASIVHSPYLNCEVFDNGIGAEIKKLSNIGDSCD